MTKVHSEAKRFAGEVLAVLLPILVVFGAIYHWYPKITGRMLDERLGPWWPPERVHVDTGYRDLALPIVAAPPEPAPAPSPPVQAAPVTAPSPPAPPAPPAPPVVVLPSSSADYLNNPRPPYPPLSKRLGEQGKVVIRAFIETNGTATKAEIRTSSGYERLDQAALQTVLKWRYVPGKCAGAAEAMWFNVPIHFVLE
mgnify:CR=1 FL=1